MQWLFEKEAPKVLLEQIKSCVGKRDGLVFSSGCDKNRAKKHKLTASFHVSSYKLNATAVMLWKTRWLYSHDDHVGNQALQVARWFIVINRPDLLNKTRYMDNWFYCYLLFCLNKISKSKDLFLL